MFPITSVTVGAGGASNINFGSIPQTFTHLQIRVFGRTDYDRGAGNLVPVSIYCNFNSDTATNYSWHVLAADGASTTSQNGTNTSGIHIGTSSIPAFRAPASVFGSFIVDILDYANTSKFKTVRTLGGVDQNGSGATTLDSGNWRSTAAINLLSFTADGNFVAGSRADLYGIQTSNATGA
jgi:hypothetical protein